MMECIGLEIQELEIVGPLVPFVLFVVLTRSWKCILLLFVLEPLVGTKLQIRNVLGFVQRIETLVLFIQITSWAYGLRRSLFQLGDPWLLRDSWVSHLIVLSREENKVVCGTSLELLVGESPVVVGFVFSCSWVFISAGDVD